MVLYVASEQRSHRRDIPPSKQPIGPMHAMREGNQASLCGIESVTLIHWPDNGWLALSRGDWCRACMRLATVTEGARTGPSGWPVMGGA
jgi:hypothetical protein